MINQGHNVPDKTIAVFKSIGGESLPKELFTNILQEPKKTRDWFRPIFYRCLPLAIGNKMGILIVNQFDFELEWDGEEDPKGLKIYSQYNNPLKNQYPYIESSFGRGIFTLNLPFVLRTPPGINLMVSNPPNYIVKNSTVLTAVVETDNIRRGFGIQIKMHYPNVRTKFEANTPLAALIPIPRYASDGYEIKMAEDIFSDDLIVEEMQAQVDADTQRNYVEAEEYKLLEQGKFFGKETSRQYFRGEDVYGNKFPDHQHIK